MSQIKFINTDLASLLCSTTFIDLDEFNLNINTNSLQSTALPANLIWVFQHIFYFYFSVLLFIFFFSVFTKFMHGKNIYKQEQERGTKLVEILARNLLQGY